MCTVAATGVRRRRAGLGRQQRLSGEDRRSGLRAATQCSEHVNHCVPRQQGHKVSGQVVHLAWAWCDRGRAAASWQTPSDDSWSQCGGGGGGRPAGHSVGERAACQNNSGPLCPTMRRLPTETRGVGAAGTAPTPLGWIRVVPAGHSVKEGGLPARITVGRGFRQQAVADRTRNARQGEIQIRGLNRMRFK